MFQAEEWLSRSVASRGAEEPVGSSDLEKGVGT